MLKTLEENSNKEWQMKISLVGSVTVISKVVYIWMHYEHCASIRNSVVKDFSTTRVVIGRVHPVGLLQQYVAFYLW